MALSRKGLSAPERQHRQQLQNSQLAGHSLAQSLRHGHNQRTCGDTERTVVFKATGTDSGVTPAGQQHRPNAMVLKWFPNN